MVVVHVSAHDVQLDAVLFLAVPVDIVRLALSPMFCDVLSQIPPRVPQKEPLSRFVGEADEHRLVELLCPVDDL